MQIIRYQLGTGQPQVGWVLDDKVGPIRGDIFGEFQRGEAVIPLNSVRLLAPLTPGKIICVGRNYAAHAQEHGSEVPEIPLLFFKPPSAVIGPEDTVVLPPQSQQV